jgi:hypothetical protein
LTFRDILCTIYFFFGFFSICSPCEVSELQQVAPLPCPNALYTGLTEDSAFDIDATSGKAVWQESEKTTESAQTYGFLVIKIQKNLKRCQKVHFRYSDRLIIVQCTLKVKVGDIET